jgi:hypothetical protein
MDERNSNQLRNEAIVEDGLGRTSRYAARRSRAYRVVVTPGRAVIDRGDRMRLWLPKRIESIPDHRDGVDLAADQAQDAGASVSIAALVVVTPNRNKSFAVLDPYSTKRLSPLAFDAIARPGRWPTTSTDKVEYQRLIASASGKGLQP